MMKNLEQIRAKNALVAAKSIQPGKEGSQAVAKKVPTQIIENGFLGALAFAIEEGKDGKDRNPGHYSVFKAILEHLRDEHLSFEITSRNPRELMDDLSLSSSQTLRDITAESMAYLSYLRRFAKPEKKQEGELQ